MQAVDRTIDEVSARDYDALLIPGGVGDPDRLRTEERVVSFVRELAAAGKPIAATVTGRGCSSRPMLSATAQ